MLITILTILIIKISHQQNEHINMLSILMKEQITSSSLLHTCTCNN